MIIRKSEYVISAVEKNGYPEPIGPEFVFVGRSNVGKSSFINSLTNRKNLAYTSSKPGKTQTLNFYNINDEMMFVDVPGYGYATKTKTMRVVFGKMIEEYLKTRAQIKYVFLILDIRHTPSEDDTLMYEYLKYLDLPIVIIVTKSDKIGSTKVFTHVKNIKEHLKLTNDVLVFPVSSVTKKGFENVEKLITEALNENN